MKSVVLFIGFITATWGYSQTSNEMGFGYAFTAPVATMNQNIRHGNGFYFDYFFIPKEGRFVFGADLNYTIYGYDKSRQEYTFSDGSRAPMDIVVNNSILTLMAGSRYYLSEGRSVRPYVSLRAGYAFFRTNLNIYDPDDTDHCKPVDSDLLKKDGTFILSGGAGFQWDMSKIFKRQPVNTFLFNAGAALTLGGRVQYMNTDAPPHSHHLPDADITASFINTQTQVIHEHHVGYIYSSYVEMVELRAGFIFRLQPLYGRY